jgi:hypothetical protein
MADDVSTPYLIIVANDGMGTAEKDLRHLMIYKYFLLLCEFQHLPKVVFFYTEGVKLLIEGSPILEQLKALEERGVLIIGCSTCLKHYELMQRIEVGIVGSMGDLIEAQIKMDKVIYL